MWRMDDCSIYGYVFDYWICRSDVSLISFGICLFLLFRSWQSQKTQGFRVADFVTLSDEKRSRSKIVLLFNVDKRTLRSKI